jgi:hypothetical protein
LLSDLDVVCRTPGEPPSFRRSDTARAEEVRRRFHP